MTLHPPAAQQSAPIKPGGVQHFPSSKTGVLGSVPTLLAPPSIPGLPMVGSPITAIDAIWDHGVTTLFYQWQVNGINGTGIGAHTLSYIAVVGDVGQALTIITTAENQVGMSFSVTSAPSALVAAAGTFNSTPYVILLAAA